jgi:hypothetical protein
MPEPIPVSTVCRIRGGVILVGIYNEKKNNEIYGVINKTLIRYF